MQFCFLKHSNGYNLLFTLRVNSFKWPQGGVSWSKPQQGGLTGYRAVEKKKKTLCEMKASLLGEIQEGDVSVVESRLHFPPFSHILYKPHLNKPKSTYHNNDLRSRQRWSGVGRWRKRRSPDLVLEGHDRVVLGGVDVQDVVVVLPAQVVGDVGEGSAGCLGHPVVDDDHVILAVGQRCGWVPLPQAVLRVPLLDLSYLVSGDGSFWGDERKLEKGEFKMQKLVVFFLNESCLKGKIKKVLRWVTDYSSSRWSCSQAELDLWPPCEAE